VERKERHPEGFKGLRGLKGRPGPGEGDGDTSSALPEAPRRQPNTALLQELLRMPKVNPKLITQNDRRASVGEVLDALLPSINREFTALFREHVRMQRQQWLLRLQGVYVGPARRGSKTVYTTAKGNRKKRRKT